MLAMAPYKSKEYISASLNLSSLLKKNHKNIGPRLIQETITQDQTEMYFYQLVHSITTTQ